MVDLRKITYIRVLSLLLSSEVRIGKKGILMSCSTLKSARLSGKTLERIFFILSSGPHESA